MDALILVDLQNDFTPATQDKAEGALAVADGNAVVAAVNRILPQFQLAVASQDWHPADHLSFASQHPGRRAFTAAQIDGITQMLWPDHCVRQTEGAQFLPDLDTGRIDHIVRKGTDQSIDSYSAFYDKGHLKATGLAAYLSDHEVHRVYVCGLATDGCVKHTVLDAAKLGYEAFVIRDACRGVEMREGDIEQALSQMAEAGARIITSNQLPAPLTR